MYAVFGLMFISMVVCTPTYSEEYVKGSYENWVPIPNDLYFTTIAYNDYPQYSTETTNDKNLWTPVNNDFISSAIDTGNVIQIVKHDHINKTDNNSHVTTPQPVEVDHEHESQNAERHKNISTQNFSNISSVNNSSILINNTNELGNVLIKLRNMRKPKNIQYEQTNMNNYSHDDSTAESSIKHNKIKTDINYREEENRRTGSEEILDNKASSTQSIGVNNNNRFINNLNNILSAYNILNDNIGRNYRISRQYKKEIPKQVPGERYVGITHTRPSVPHQQHLLYNNWNDVPKDPLLAVLLSRYGVTLNVGYTNLGSLSSPNYIHNT